MIDRLSAIGGSRRKALALFTAGVLVSLAACGGDADVGSNGGTDEGSAGDSVQTVRVSVPATAIPFLDVYVAQDQGFFADRNIEVELIQSQQGPSGVVNAVVAGAAEVGIPSTGVSIQALSTGAPIKAIATGASRTVTRLVGAEGVESVEDLRGQAVAVTSTSDTITYGVRQFLEQEGLSTGDYEEVIVPSSADRLAALTSGGAAAANLAPPLDFRALSEGYTDLGLIVTDDTLSDHIVTESFLADNADLAADYVAAINEAHEWINDPANEDEAAAILAEVTELPEELTAQAVALYLEEEVFLPTAEVSVSGAEASIEAVEALGQLQSEVTTDDYIDNGPFDSISDGD